MTTPADPAPGPPPEANPPGDAASMTDLVVEVGIFSVYLTLVVFVAGWSYADRWFAELGLNLSAVDGIEAETYSAWALWVIQDGWLGLLILAILIGFVGGWAAVRRVASTVPRVFASAALALAAVAALLAAGYLGAALASRQVSTVFAAEAPPFVRVRVVAEPESVVAAFLEARGDLGTSTCLRTVFMDRSHLYVYAGYESLRGSVPDIAMLPLSQIAVIEVIRNPGLCAP